MDQLHKQFYENDKKKHPQNYEKHPLLKFWFHPMGIESFIDSPLHLLFLGMMKDVHKNTIAWCKRLNIESISLKKTFQHTSIRSFK